MSGTIDTTSFRDPIRKTVPFRGVRYKHGRPKHLKNQLFDNGPEFKSFNKKTVLLPLGDVLGSGTSCKRGDRGVNANKRSPQ